MTKDHIRTLIQNMEQKLKETRDSIEWNHGPVRDALKLTIPMMEDQLTIQKALLELMP